MSRPVRWFRKQPREIRKTAINLAGNTPALGLSLWLFTVNGRGWYHWYVLAFAAWFALTVVNGLYDLQRQVRVWRATPAHVRYLYLIQQTFGD